MPELPEVETVCRGLAKVLTGQRLIRVDAHRPDLRVPLPKNLAARLKGRRVLSIHRRAKYILMTLNHGDTLVLHLGMSGRMVINHEATKPGTHDHLGFYFENGAQIFFHDPRRFGLCDLIATKDLKRHKLFHHLGVEPLAKGWTAALLAKHFRAKTTSIKDALMDQRLVVGIGNIYASESLYAAGISPKRLAGSLSLEEIHRLVLAVRKILRAAIKAGGSSLRDYVQADGELGSFQHAFAVYGRAGKPCPDCICDIKKTGGIGRILLGGRSSFYCSRRQT
jgi:formamidopyrimidine-DNA glycosylase